MRKLALALCAATALVGVNATSRSAMAAPVAGAIPSLPDSGVEQAQYRWHGQDYCFYPGGWHGPGWYRCGWQHRRGRGWGGPMGWHRWEAPGGGMGRDRGRGHDMDHGRDMDRGGDRSQQRGMDHGDKGAGQAPERGAGTGSGTGAGTGSRPGSGGDRSSAPGGERPRDVRPPSGTSGGGAPAPN